MFSARIAFLGCGLLLAIFTGSVLAQENEEIDDLFDLPEYKSKEEIEAEKNPAEPEKKLDPRAESSLLLRRYRAAGKKNPQELTAVVKRAAELGPVAADRLNPLLRTELNSLESAYGGMFYAQAMNTRAEKVDQVLASLEALQQKREAVLFYGKLVETLNAALTQPMPAEQTYDAYLAGLEEASLRKIRLGEILSQLDDAEIRAIEETNKQRVAQGLQPLEVDLQLSLAARDHSSDMEKHDFFSHTSPLPGKTSFSDRAKRFNAVAAGENIYMGSTDGAVAVEAWMNSPPHKENILTPNFTRIGIGRHNRHFTQLFGR